MNLSYVLASVEFLGQTRAALEDAGVGGGRGGILEANAAIILQTAVRLFVLTCARCVVNTQESGEEEVDLRSKAGYRSPLQMVLSQTLT